MANYYETGSFDVCYNLAYEEYLLERGDADALMLWQDAPSVVIGLNQNAAEEVDALEAARRGVTVVRRRTGGGAVYHDLGNLNYSFITEAGDEAALSFESFTRPVCEALASLGVRAEASGRNDITVAGLKVSGTARRLHKGRVLHHGTLLFRTDREAMAALLRPDSGKFSGKAAKSVRSRVGQLCDFLPEGTTLAEFKAALLRSLMPGGAEITPLPADALEDISRRAELYRSRDWTWTHAPDFGFRNSRRFPGGGITVSLDVSHGEIRAAHISGDFMAAAPCGALISALERCRYEPEAVRAALSPLELGAMLGGISLDELMEVLFG